MESCGQQDDRRGARRLGTWQLSFQGAMLVVAANTPACLRVTLARRWR